MAFRLPPIRGTVRNTAYVEAHRHTERVLADINDVHKPRRLPSLRKPICSDFERAMMARLKLVRQAVPSLTPDTTRNHRYSYLHTLLVTVLQDGYHNSFTRIFNIIEKHRSRRVRAGPHSELWLQPLLENQHEKLDALRFYLIKSEEADRKGEVQGVYNAQLALAQFFLQTGDSWLSDHFFDECLGTCLNQEEPENLRTTAEAYCNMGLVSERNGDFEQAALYFESFHQLTKSGKAWENNEGVSLFKLASMYMARIYVVLSDILKKAARVDECVEYLLKAYDFVQNCDKKCEGYVYYKLGLVYEITDSFEKSSYFLKKYYEISRLRDDSYSIGLACEALGRLNFSAGNMEVCMKYLDEFLRVAEKSGIESELNRASEKLGVVHNILGKYSTAVQCFSRVLDYSFVNDRKAEPVARTCFGIATAHGKLSRFAAHVGGGATCFTKLLIRWKGSREELNTQLLK